VGKAKTFTHIHANFMILIKINSIKNHPIKRGRKSIVLKMFDLKGFESFSLKTFDITEQNKWRIK